ncbi:hypothetical protein [Rhodococcus sp. 06-1477-1A]|uniref:hypothetical protein n=1 Tax=Rhodococcus sp. 06-1477-1A TaxID=2022497 RepID=UPI000B9C4050|nr:hypothetical protein [Rhodococcus sp. 06-1477-1A]OZD43514.1 hypothetical protein CH264_17705 [Rhodococcus sp. 06-1477-1A]
MTTKTFDYINRYGDEIETTVPAEALAWMDAQVAPATGWFVVYGPDPKGDVFPIAAWVTQELRRPGEPGVYDTRVVAARTDSDALPWAFEYVETGTLVHDDYLLGVLERERAEAHRYSAVEASVLVLRHATDNNGITRPALVDAMRPNLKTDEPRSKVNELETFGYITVDDAEVVTLTDKGRQALRKWEKA